MLNIDTSDLSMAKKTHFSIFWKPRLFKFLWKITNLVGPLREMPAQTWTLGLRVGLPALSFSVSSSRFLCHSFNKN